MGEWNQFTGYGLWAGATQAGVQPSLVNPNNDWYMSPWNFAPNYGGHENPGAFLIEKTPCNPYFGGLYYDIGQYGRLGEPYPANLVQCGEFGGGTPYEVPEPNNSHTTEPHSTESTTGHNNAMPPWETPQQWIPQPLNFNHNGLGAGQAESYSQSNYEQAMTFADALGAKDGKVTEDERLNAMYSLSVQALYLQNAGKDPSEVLKARKALEALAEPSASPAGH